MCAFKQAFIKLNPLTLYRNPIMFTVFVSTVVMGIVTIGLSFGKLSGEGTVGYNLAVFIILLFTLQISQKHWLKPVERPKRMHFERHGKIRRQKKTLAGKS